MQMAQIQALQSMDLYLSLFNIPSEAQAIILGVSLSPLSLKKKKKKVSWFYLAVGKVLILKPQGGLWDEKEAGPFPPWF